MRRQMTADGPRLAVRVPAKVNLFLAVRGRLPDGYHDLVSVLQTVSIYDELQVGVVGRPGRGHHPASRRAMRIQLVQEPFTGLPRPRDNLAARAAIALGQASGLLSEGDVWLDAGDPSSTTDPDVPRTVLQLRKRIPVGGGMAGGSADAAAALVGLNELWGLDLSRQRLREVGATLGSDVPFCVVGGTALATGRGTALAQVLARGAFHWVVGQSAQPLSTADVYAAWDRRCRPGEMEPDAMLQALRNQDPVAMGAALSNDLEPAAFSLRAELEEQKAALLDAGALGAVLSGSGPTLMALAADAMAARRIAASVSDRFSRVTVAQSPAGGPELHDNR